MGGASDGWVDSPNARELDSIIIRVSTMLKQGKLPPFNNKNRDISVVCGSGWRLWNEGWHRWRLAGKKNTSRVSHVRWFRFSLIGEDGAPTNHFGYISQHGKLGREHYVHAGFGDTINTFDRLSADPECTIWVKSLKRAIRKATA